MSYACSARVVFANMLGTLDHLATKAEDGGVTDVVLSEKLTEDMFPLELQFRVALNQVLLPSTKSLERTYRLRRHHTVRSQRFANESPLFARELIKRIRLNGQMRTPPLVLPCPTEFAF